MDYFINQDKSYKDKELYIRLAKYLKDYWKIFAVSVLAMLVVAGTAPLFAYLIKPLINEGFVDKNMEKMTWLPIAIVLLFIIRGIFNFINEYSSSYLSSHLVQRIRLEMFAKMLRLPSGYFNENSSGRLISRILSDSGQITEAGFGVITVLVKDGVTVIGLMGLLLYLDWRLTLITFVALPIVGLCVRIISKRLRKLSLQNQQYAGKMVQILSETLNGAKVVKVYGGQEHEQRRFFTTSNNIRRNGVKQTAASSASSAITQLLIATALAFILYLAAYFSQSNDFSAGDFMSFLSAMLMMFDPIKRLTGVIQSVQRGLAAAQSVFTLLDEPDEPNGGTLTLPRNTGDIEFINIEHRYPNAETNSINQLSLVVPQGKVVALVGASGCGKTTLVNMLPRFFAPVSGSIKIAGEDIRDYTLDSLRQQMAMVSQDVVLFNGTIAENIAYGGNNKASEAEIIAAAKAANAWEFIEKQADGLNTEIGENGMNLSGGQRQRIAIARALLKDAPILILDEATSALDNESERLVQTALDKLMKNRTTIVIAHRLSTVEKADLIVVMNEGRIVEQGTHKELLAKQGRYSDLYHLQFKE